MLLNNFRPLLLFGGNGTFVNVLGETVNMSAVISYEYSDALRNNHQTAGCSRSFNYTTCLDTNNYTDEQTSYGWFGVTNNNVGDTARVNNGFVIFVGTGDTAVTPNDYCLDTAVELDVVAASCTVNGDGVVTVSRTFENNTGDDVLIKEMGVYFFKTGMEQYGELTAYPIVMIGRKVLTTPVTIPDGEQRTFEYVIHMENISFSNAG